MDTRRTGALLAKHDIANPGMVVTNEHTERKAVDRVIDELSAGRRVALVSDAGMPTISDPGAAPTSFAIRSPVFCGEWNQPASFQPRMSISPHSSAIMRLMRSGTAFGKGPRELPSR